MKQGRWRGIVTAFAMGACAAQFSHGAGITCTRAALTNVSFGTVNPLSSQTSTTATLSYTCNNTDTRNTHSATVCFSIGEPAAGQTNPRLMTSGSNTLQFQLYQNASYSSVWGSQFFGSFQTPLPINMTLAKSGTTTATATLYAQVLGAQTSAAAGNYADDYATGDTAVTVNDVTGTTAPGSCNGTSIGVYFPFNVTATVQKVCTVSANNLSFGSIAAGATPAAGTTTLTVACSSGSPYYIGLSPSNGNTTGVGAMKATGTDTIAYTLYSNAGHTTIWGNTASATSVGNGVSGTGTGVAQSLTVYGGVTGSTDVQPGSYADTVTVNVNY